MKPICLICARGGLKGVPNKNIRIISKKPLIAHTITSAINSKLFSHVVVSTENKNIAQISKKYGAEVPFLRSLEASSSTAMEQDILKDLYDSFEKENIPQPDILVWLRPTFVFRNFK